MAIGYEQITIPAAMVQASIGDVPVGASALYAKASGSYASPVDNAFVDTVTFRHVAAIKRKFWGMVDRVDPVHLPDGRSAATPGNPE